MLDHTVLPILPAGNGTTNGSCPYPFLDDRYFPHNGGYLQGRFCASAATPSNATCCLPCPLQNWEYDDPFLHSIDNVSYVALFSLIGCLFLLISWVVLPASQSGRHYLSVGLVSGGLLVALAFVIPVSMPTKDTCFNAITPGDMNTSFSCAITGALLQAGCLSAAVWVLMRSIWLHLRVVWDRTPGKLFSAVAFFTAIFIPAVLLAITIAVSGFSYRTGKVCLLKHDGNSFVLFWGLLIICGVLAVALQVFTTLYCVWVYMHCHRMKSKSYGSELSENSGVSTGSRLKSFRNKYTHPFNRITTDEPLMPVTTGGAGRWRNLKLVFTSQWRNLVLTSLFAMQSVYFATVFWTEDLKIVDVDSHPRIQAFVECLVVTGGDRDECLEDAEYLMLQKEHLLAGLVLIALTGLQCFLLLVRRQVFVAWWDLITDPKTLFSRGKSDGRPRPPTKQRFAAQASYDHNLPMTSPVRHQRRPQSTASDLSADFAWTSDVITDNPWQFAPRPGPNLNDIDILGPPAPIRPARTPLSTAETTSYRKPISIVGARRLSSQSQTVKAAAGTAWTSQVLHSVPQREPRSLAEGDIIPSSSPLQRFESKLSMTQRELPLPPTPAASRSRDNSRPSTPQHLRGTGHNGLMMNPVMEFASRPSRAGSPTRSEGGAGDLDDPLTDAAKPGTPAEKRAASSLGLYRGSMVSERLSVVPRTPRRVSRFVEDMEGCIPVAGVETPKHTEETAQEESRDMNEADHDGEGKAPNEGEIGVVDAKEGMESPIDPDLQGRKNVDARIGMAM